MRTGAGVLQGIADNIQKRYGMVVAIFLAGPIPEDNGQIGVQK